ncbi:glycosyltransferase family 2 protein [Microbulbifer sp. ALW1]|uniref:glycosyltransferase family 2 protein n=1 Tax=Microbulbifer sp. (strain ALW1) TaxID=1516059 RepID=UPI001F1C6F64|nr:glycosyltransferase family 2 protein [Microbulbifer sp. ALW1]
MFGNLSRIRFKLTVELFKIARRIPLGVVFKLRNYHLVQALFRLLKDEAHRERFSYLRLIDLQQKKIAKLSDRSSSALSFTVLIKVGLGNVELLTRTLDSLMKQRYSRLEIYVIADPTLIHQVESQRGDRDVTTCTLSELDNVVQVNVSRENYIFFMDSGDLLHENTLRVISDSCVESNYPPALYTDSDTYGENDIRTEPRCKPKWSPDYFLEYNYIEKGVFFKLGSIPSGFEKYLETSVSEANYCTLLDLFFNGPNDVVISSLAYILYHENRDNVRKPPSRLAIQRLTELGQVCGFNIKNHKDNQRQIEWHANVENCFVSIIIPTKDRVDLLSQCIDSILGKSTFQNIEIIVVDNDSVESTTASYLKEISKNSKIRVISYPGEFNFSAINNHAVKAAKGQLIAFVNNDIEVITPDWLNILASHALRPEIGCVGAKLLYPDGSVQHGGVVIGIGGVAGHAHKRAPGDSKGYMNRLVTSQNYSAVTGACLVVRKKIFEDLGGFDDENLKVAFNDVDFCLKVRRAGYRNLWSPAAVLYHHESVSRGDDRKGAAKRRFESEIKHMKTVWNTDSEHDPAYNPNLARYREDFGLITLD